MGMGCQVATCILKEDASELTEKAKQKFIDEVKDIVINGSENLRIPSPFPCGDPIPPNPNIDPQNFNLEDENIFPDFHKNVIKGQYEKIAKSLNVESTFSLLPALADPIALAGSFGIEMPEISFPSGFVPYFTGLLVPKFAVDLLSAGVTDFFPPVKLVPKLTELIKIPEIPSIPLPPNVTFPPPIPGIPNPSLTLPSPGSLGLPSVPQLPGIELPPIPGIPNPLESLTDYVELQIAIATGIPNLLTSMIGKIPGFLPKLGDPKSILAEICGMVRDSGIFGNIKPTSTVQAAATVVLARKTAECTLNAAFASTIGMAPGSAGCAINQQISGYDTISKKPPTKGPQTPAQRVLSYARGLVGVSAGQNDGEPYTSSLYFAEAAIAQMGKGKVNLLGEPIDIEDENTKKYIDPKSLVGVQWTKEHTKYAPMENPPGQYEYAKLLALQQSSCALFARSCYYAGGFNAGFCLSLYPPATAPAGLRLSFIMRNFKWLKDDGKFNEELYEVMRKIFLHVNSQYQEDPTKAQNQAINAIDSIDLDAVPVGKDKYEMKPISHSKELMPYLKPFNERPYIGPRELAAIVRKRHPDCPEFPAVNPGDIIYVVGDKNNDHVSVVEQARPPGFPTGSSKTTLEKPFYCIDGGQVDPYNIGSGPEVTYDVEASKVIAPAHAAAGNMMSDEILNKYNGVRFKDNDGIIRTLIKVDKTKVATAEKDKDGKATGKTVKIDKNYTAPPYGEPTVGMPTGILRVKRDQGATMYGATDIGFYLGAQKITLANNNVTEVGEIRKITYILRADLLLNERENSGLEAGIAAAAQDEITAFLWKRRLEQNGADIQRVWKCFPTLGTAAYKKANADAKAKAEAEKAKKT